MHEGKLAGFTIIEFVIAVAISVILVSVGIPRYNSFVQRQDFIAGMQTFSSCFQAAQQGAIAPATQYGAASGTAVRFMEARILQSAASATSTCEVRAYDSADQIITGIPVKSFTTDQLLFTSLSTDGEGVVPFASSVQLFFGTLENGAPVELRSGTQVLKSPPVPGNPQPTDVPYGRGFTLTVLATSVNLASLTGSLTMERLGTPVQISVSSP